MTPGSGTRLTGGALVLPLCFGALCLIWGSTYVVLKIALRHSGPATQVGLRWLIGALMLGGLALLLRRRLPVSPVAHLQTAVVGVLNVAGLAGLMALGLTAVSAGESSLLIYTQPLQVALLSAWLLGERLASRRVAGLLLGFAGLAVVLAPRIQPGAAPAWWAYAALLLGAGCWALSSVLYRGWLRAGSPLAKADTLWLTALQAVYGVIPLLLIAAAVEGLRVDPTPDFFWTLAFTGLLSGGVANLLWFFLLARRAATVVASYVFLVPVVAVLCGVLFLGEAFTVDLMAGGLLTLAGITLVTRAS